MPAPSVWRVPEIAAVSVATRARFAEFQARQAVQIEVKRTVGRALRAQHANGPIGHIPSDVGELQAWAFAAAADFIAGDRAEDIGPKAARLPRDYLTKHVIERGHAQNRAEEMTRFVFRDLEVACPRHCRASSRLGPIPLHDGDQVRSCHGCRRVAVERLNAKRRPVFEACEQLLDRPYVPAS